MLIIYDNDICSVIFHWPNKSNVSFGADLYIFRFFGCVTMNLLIVRGSRIGRFSDSMIGTSTMRPAPVNAYFKGKYYCSLHRYPSCAICGKQQLHARFQVGWTCANHGILWVANDMAKYLEEYKDDKISNLLLR